MSCKQVMKTPLCMSESKTTSVWTREQEREVRANKVTFTLAQETLRLNFAKINI